MKKTLLLTLLFALFATSGFSQTDKFWSVNNEIRSNINTDKAVARLSFPAIFKLFDLNIDPLRRELFSIVGNRASGHSTVISLPNADGGIEQFEVFEASNFEPVLQARFPEIRAFSGKGITDKYATLKLSISLQGIQTMVFRTEKENEFIEAYSQNHTVYAVFKSQRKPGQLPWTCSTEDRQMDANYRAQIGQINNPTSNTGELKTIRLAQSCNGEYSNWFGAFNATQVGLVLAAYNATLTRCNGCYEKDLALHLNLIANTSDVIFYDPATDPYTTMGNWNNQLQTTLTNIIGEANYDIGHMFGASGGGGNAGCIGCVCVDFQKGRGITSPADGIPQGDNFDIDYVVHEVGHQLGGNHSFTFSNEGTQAQKEVGAGITIMGYAGITSYDPAPHSIDIFHEANIQQIQTNLASKTCPTNLVMTANNPPVVSAVSNYTIPISTPFALTGSATDPENDPITYCWEQNDVHGGQTGANSVAYATKPTGPNWLSFSPTTSPTRLFPKLSTILAGLLITPTLPGGDAICNIEALSSVSRALNFRLTVRDNCPYVPGVKIGQTAFTDMTVTVSNTSGPFQVTSPNTNVSWAEGSSQTITWLVNGTTGAPVSCANVKITLSIDGGTTFPYVLSASTPNDGTEVLTIPNGTVSTTARIKVEAVGNIFFDISNTNFTITASSNPTFTFVTPAPTTVACGTAAAAITLATTSVMSFVTPINLVATGNPAGTNVTYSVNPVIPGNSTVVTLNNVNTLAPGTYPVTITGTAGAEVKTVILSYIVSQGAGPAITAQPAPQTVCAGTNATFSIVSASATGFQWQESTNGGGSWNTINNGGVYSGATTATLTLTGVTAGMNNYQYRCVASVLCGSTNSNAVLLTVNTAPAIISQPANSTVCGGSSSGFCITATGTGLTYQWQESVTGCGGPWNNLANGAPYSGVTTTCLTIALTTPAMNGYAYRCLVTGTCAPTATSACGLLTVNTPITISSQPSPVTVCENVAAQANFTVGATGTTPAYQWQESINGGANWNNITNAGIYSGATTATLTITGISASMTGYQYRVIVSGAAPCGAVNSNAALLTVNTAPVITTQPVASTTLCVGGNTTYTAAASGTAVTYQWQLSTAGAGGPWNNIADGGVYSGATTGTLTITGVTATMNGYQYRCSASGTCAPTNNSNPGVLTVNTPINITTQPAAITNICATGATSFTTTVTGTSPTYQWQQSTDGGTNWTNVSNGGIFNGATTTTLSLTGITAGMNGNRYRTVITGTAPCGTVNSNSAVLNVTPQPSISASSASLLAGQQSTLTVNVTPAPGLSFAWYLNGVLQSATGNSIIATVNELGSYRVIVTSATGSCQSELKEITAEPSSKLFVFPSPNNGIFQVSYYTSNASATNTTTQSISIYDSYGRLVLNNVYPVSQAYQLHRIDMRRNGAGVYYIVLREANGNKIKTGEVVVR